MSDNGNNIGSGYFFSIAALCGFIFLIYITYQIFHSTVGDKNMVNKDYDNFIMWILGIGVFAYIVYKLLSEKSN